jgi:uncharacterized protein (TIRG00374 family)
MTGRRRQLSHRLLWRALQVALAVLIAGGIFLAVIPNIADYRAVWRVLSTRSLPELGIVAAVAALNLFTYWLQSIAAMPGLTLWMAAVQTQTTTTVANTVPGGGAIAVGVSYAMFRSWGYAEGDVARYTLVTGIWNTYIKLGLPVVALALFAFESRTDPRLGVAAAIGVAALIVSIVLLALVLWKTSFARSIGRGLSRPVRFVRERFLHRARGEDWGTAAVRFRRESVDLVRDRWIALTVTTIVSHLTLFVVLLVSIRTVGIGSDRVSWIEAFAAFAFARLVTALPVTPGGLGVIELSYIGGLVWAGGGRADAVAAVLLFRALTFFLQIPLGGITYVVWQRTQDRWHRTDRSPRRGSASKRSPGDRTRVTT